MKKGLMILGMGLFFLTQGVPASAQPEGQGEAIGRVVALRGEVVAVEPGGNSRPLAIKAEVFRSDTVKTGARGRVQLMFADNTIVNLGRRSEITLAEYEWDPEARQGKMKTRVKEGAFRVLGGAITKVAPEKFTTETPVATIGIRGSMYAGRLRGMMLKVVFQGGRGIYVTNPAGTVDIDRPGLGTQVDSPGNAPGAPRPFSAEELEELTDEFTPPVGEEEGSASEEAPPGGETVVEETDSEGGDQGEPLSDTQGEETTQSGSGNSTPPTSTTSDELLTSEEGQDFDQWETASLDPADESLDAGGLLLDSSTQDPLLTTQELTHDSITESSQESLNTQIDQSIDEGTTSEPEPAPAPPPAVVEMSGGYIGILAEQNSLTGTRDRRFSGENAATSTDGQVVGRTLLTDGTSVRMTVTIPPHDPEIPFTGAKLFPGQPRTVNLLGSDRQLSTDVISSDRGEFAYFVTDQLFTEGTTSYLVQELGFLGVPSSPPPQDGIERYQGLLAGGSTAGTAVQPINAELNMGVNWHSGKVFGALTGGTGETGTADQGPPVFFFGDVSGSGLSNLRIIGSDAGPTATGTVDIRLAALAAENTVQTSHGEPATISGTGTFGQFYGSAHQGVGFTAVGSTASLFDPTLVFDDWQVAGGAFLQPGAPLSSATATTGSALWEGFVVGIGEDVSAPDLDRRLFMNSDPSTFALVIDRDAGSISGTLSATDRATGTSAIDNLTIGGSGASAYVADHALIALLDCPAAGCIQSEGIATGITGEGNFLVTRSPEKQFGEHLSWGYWESAYVDPANGVRYHVHAPGSLWVAGQRTSAAELQSLIDSGFIGRYTGGAEGSVIDSAGILSPLTGGATDLTIDFAPGSTAPVAGTIGFTEQTLTVGPGGSVDTAGFQAGIAGSTAGRVDGAFFGPGAQAVGGSFDAELNGNRYQGIFGGNLTPPPTTAGAR